MQRQSIFGYAARLSLLLLIACMIVAAYGNSSNAATLAPGGSFSFTFKQAGSFSYHCMFHPYMTAMITVS
jgi:plastocyanin